MSKRLLQCQNKRKRLASCVQPDTATNRHWPYTVSRGLPETSKSKLVQLRRLKREFDHMESRYGMRTQHMITVQCEQLHYRLYHERYSYRVLTKQARQRIRRRLWERFTCLLAAPSAISLVVGLFLWIITRLFPLSPDAAWATYFIATFVLSLPVAVWLQLEGML